MRFFELRSRAAISSDPIIYFFNLLIKIELRSLAEISSDRLFVFFNLLIKIEFLSLNNNYNKINENTHKF